MPPTCGKAFPDGWVACEIKLGVRAVDAAAASLKSAVSNIETQLLGAPDAMVVVTGSGPGFRRPDGVDVVPIAALMP
jgi:hypothetical protein